MMASNPAGFDRCARYSIDARERRPLRARPPETRTHPELVHVSPLQLQHAEALQFFRRHQPLKLGGGGEGGRENESRSGGGK